MIRAVLGHRDGSEQAWAETNTGTEERKNSFFPKPLGPSKKSSTQGNTVKNTPN